MSDGLARAAVVVLAAGSGARVGHDVNKVLLPLGGRPVFAWSLQTASESNQVHRVVLVVSERDRSRPDLTSVADRLGAEIVIGGDTRHASERLALEALADDVGSGRLDVVAIHDAARPLATVDLLDTVIATARRRGGAIPVRRQPSVIVIDPADADAALSLGDLVAVQTPQAFRAAPLLAAYRRADREGFVGTDTASCVERFTDLEIVGVPSSAENLKITFVGDFAVAEELAGLRPAAEGPATADRPDR
jgi:2-C-methyl-D-erythritol 4-phosphate cytidylyltransferase